MQGEAREYAHTVVSVSRRAEGGVRLICYRREA
jgi:hypothetical protein